MIEHSIPEIGSWDHAGGCQACDNKGEIHRFVLRENENANMGWTVRLCDKCLNDMQLLSQGKTLMF